jgi:hypothetical protein
VGTSEIASFSVFLVVGFLVAKNSTSKSKTLA